MVGYKRKKQQTTLFSFFKERTSSATAPAAPTRPLETPSPKREPQVTKSPGLETNTQLIKRSPQVATPSTVGSTATEPSHECAPSGQQPQPQFERNDSKKVHGHEARKLVDQLDKEEQEERIISHSSSRPRKSRRVIEESEDEEESKDLECNIDGASDESHCNARSIGTEDHISLPQVKKSKPSPIDETAKTRQFKSNAPPPSKKTPNSSLEAKMAWKFLLDSKGAPLKAKSSNRGGTVKKASIANTSSNANVRNILKSPYTGGDDLPILTHPQQMFDDMIFSLFRGRKIDRLLPLLQKLQHRPLRVATMCSGTESPILALDMIKKSMETLLVDSTTNVYSNEQSHVAIPPEEVLPMEHVFSCEIEPFKQAYIERNFHPPRLFRDIRELGGQTAYTAYGAEIEVPNSPGCVDILIAGTSCVDYSNLNNSKKNIDDRGESGQTFWGMMDWIDKAQPPLIIIENVFGAPWAEKVKIFQDRGYAADFLRLDTKDFYIPHTRQRGYLFAVKQQQLSGQSVENERKKLKTLDRCVTKWAETIVKKLKRPASAELDAFMFPNDDPRVLRGRARLTAACKEEDGQSRAGRVDWTKCETLHHQARFMEKLGDKRPLTGWSESGNCTMPSFAWNEWVNAQVHRIHDLLDINSLRLAQEGVDAVYKTMVWNLSQNVDRDTMGKLGLCQCLTPSGVPYVTSRGGPLVGEELLGLQGIPSEDLILTKESEANLKDLAGNAMSTTVVGACMLSALLHGHDALVQRKDENELSTGFVASVPSLVPRPLVPASEVVVTQDFGSYQTRPLLLGPRRMENGTTIGDLLKEAHASSRKCLCEGLDEALPVESIMICKECGHTCSALYAAPERKAFYEEHEFIPLRSTESRISPSDFRQKLIALLPMRLEVSELHANAIEKPDGVCKSLWEGWKKCLKESTNSVTTDNRCIPSEFRFSHLVRGTIWTANYVSPGGASRLELRLSSTRATWLLFAKPPLTRGPLRVAMERPLARLNLSNSGSSIADGSWELCLPETTSIKLSIQGIGKKDSWRCRLGLEGDFASETRYEKLRISVPSHICEEIKASIDGEYRLLPKCAAACGSLMKKVKTVSSIDGADEEDLFFFLESGRYTLPDDDTYIFSRSCHRTSYGEYRESLLHIDPKMKYRPIRKMNSDEDLKDVKAILPGRWVSAVGASMKLPGEGANVVFTEPRIGSNLTLKLKLDGWKICPEVISCNIPVSANDDIARKCRSHASLLQLNLHKSKQIFQALAFATSRLKLPGIFSERGNGWISLDSSDMPKVKGDEVVCLKCAPTKPRMRWTPVQKRGKRIFEPIEDGREAAVYERSLKERPSAWVVRLGIAGAQKEPDLLHLRVSFNCVSLIQRALGLFPKQTLARNAMIGSNDENSRSKCQFDWRIVNHFEKPMANFPSLRLTSNKKDMQTTQPPNFKRFKLRHEQLRSLYWMLQQESTCKPFFEEEVTEEVLPSLEWRAEGRVRRPVLVKGGIVADEVGYGKTAITLGLIDKADEYRPIPSPYRSSYIETSATLVVVPAHLMGQWPAEITKFLGSSKAVVVIKDLNCLNKTTVKQIKEADIVVVNFTVLSNEKYFARLSRLAGAATLTMPKGRHFETVYSDFLTGLTNRVKHIKEDTGTVYAAIKEDEKKGDTRMSLEGSVRLDGKKSAYKIDSKTTKEKVCAHTKDVADPWNLSKQARHQYEKMSCPPLEMFFWKRLVVDEFTYLSNEKRGQTLCLILGLKAHSRWCLSGTPPHANFKDIQFLAALLGIHLGIEESLPGARKQGKEERTGLESLSNFLELRTMQWHERRHMLAQAFLDRFVRQNIAEIDEIPYEEHVESIVLPPAERAIYLELETHLRSLDMKSKSAQKSKKRSTGDRESRMKQVLEDSSSAEEALLKRCSHFNMSGSSSATALEKCNEIIQVRRKQKELCEDELVDSIAAALQQRRLILTLDPGWLGTKMTEKGEVQDRLEMYLNDVKNLSSVSGGADKEIHHRITELVEMAHRRKVPLKKYEKLSAYLDSQSIGDICDDNTTALSQKMSGTRKRKRADISETAISQKDNKKSDERLYDMKFALREHMHSITSLGKELCGRIRSLRYFQWVRNFQHLRSDMPCPMCSADLSIDRVGVLSSCGHIGCLDCLNRCAADGYCVEKQCRHVCQARVNAAHVVSAVNLGADEDHSNAGKYGAKLTAIVEKVKEIIASGDRMIVFVQFDDLKEKVREVLADHDILSLQITGNIRKMIKAVEPFQKEKPGKKDPRVLLLKMDDEQSAGLNLTNLNHAIFVHPLLATTKQAYQAYETQAIGRIRRFGQTKTVQIWRFLVTNSIDTEIYLERTGQSTGN